MKTFTIKGHQINVVTSQDGRKAPALESMPALMRLTIQYGDALKSDKEAIAMAEYLKQK